jgi:type II secretory pathway pseudopilin PulG
MDRSWQRGTTLLEVMAAMSILIVAGVGTLGLHTQQLKMNGDARRITEATALAQDMVENMALWSWGDARLANTNTANDTDLGDSAFQFELASPPYDHAEADLTAGGVAWNGIAKPKDGFERYWNVAYVDDIDGNGTWDAVRIAVIVRWQGSTGWRRIVLLTTKANPSEVQ